MYIYMLYFVTSCENCDFEYIICSLSYQHLYRVALALQKETAYTYPFGAVVGALSALFYQITLLPLADEYIQSSRSL